jgi:hypothetical protein
VANGAQVGDARGLWPAPLDRAAAREEDRSCDERLYAEVREKRRRAARKQRGVRARRKA